VEQTLKSIQLHVTNEVKDSCPSKQQNEVIPPLNLPLEGNFLKKHERDVVLMIGTNTSSEYVIDTSSSVESHTRVEQ
jgi:hypothetical protein